MMSNDAKKILSEVAIYTAVPADLLAIVPVVLRLFDKEFSWSENIRVENIQIPTLNIAVGRDFFIVMVVYAATAFLYWLVTNIKAKSGKQKYNLIRAFSVSILLAFCIPLLSILISFGSIQGENGFALFIVCIFISISILHRWSNDDARYYKDMGLGYLWILPIPWLLFQYENPEPWLSNLLWAWIYTATGYLFSVGMVGVTILIFIMPVSHLGFQQRVVDIVKSMLAGSIVIQDKDFWFKRFNLFKKLYKFEDNGWVAIGTLALLILIGLFVFLVWLIKLLLIILAVLAFIAFLGLAAYFDATSKTRS
jgi:hypothetical protein